MNTLKVTDKQLIEAIIKTVNDMDADSLADVAQHVIGGKIFPPDTDDNFTVEKDETYFGALD